MLKDLAEVLTDDYLTFSTRSRANHSVGRQFQYRFCEVKEQREALRELKNQVRTHEALREDLHTFPVQVKRLTNLLSLILEDLTNTAREFNGHTDCALNGCLAPQHTSPVVAIPNQE